MSPDWELRYFSHDAEWDAGEQLASMRNGQGDDWSITFGSAGVYLRGFDHESELSPWARQPPGVADGLLDGLPAVLRPAADEPAFTLEDVPMVTLALWRLPDAGVWSHAPVAATGDGGVWLFDELDGRPESYVAFAREYHEREVPVEAVRRVYAHEPVTAELVRALDPDAAVDDVLGELQAIGYPSA